MNPRYGILSGIRQLAHIHRSHRRAQSVILHRNQLRRLPWPDQLTLLCIPARRKWSCPPELTILLLHNYPRPSLMERSLQRAGIHNFTVLTADTHPWRNSIKIPTILRFLEERCRTEYVLYVDSNDAILIDDPRRAIHCLQDYNCDLLFSNTPFTAAYEYMPQAKVWADATCRTSGYENLYLNSGVYVGRTLTLREFFRTAATYVTPNDLSREEYIRRRREGTLRHVLPEFPRGVGCDQVIFQYLHPHFYPAVKIDYASQLALR